MPYQDKESSKNFEQAKTNENRENNDAVWITKRINEIVLQFTITDIIIVIN